MDQFTASLDRLDVGWNSATVGDLSDVLEELIEAPSVGASLPFDGVSLEALGITVEPTPRQIREARTGVTRAVLGVADYGTVVIESAADATEAASLFPERHIAVLSTDAIVPDMAAALEQLGQARDARGIAVVLVVGELDQDRADAGARRLRSALRAAEARRRHAERRAPAGIRQGGHSQGPRPAYGHIRLSGRQI